MQFDPPLVTGRFVKRYKRFFVDVELEGGEIVVAHCPNTGSLTGCLIPGAEVAIAPANNPERKLRWTWNLVRIGDTWVGVHTGSAVPLVAAAITDGALPELSGFERCTAEVRYGREGKSRIDLLLSSGGRPEQAGQGTKRKQRISYKGDRRVYVEVKNTTLVRETVAAFPDAVTTRGQKHLEELMHVVQEGHRAAMVYCVQRDDCARFTPADDVDPRYGELLREAVEAGVEAYAMRARVNPSGIRLDTTLPIDL